MCIRDRVYIPQLPKRKSKLLEMKSRLPKERVEEQYGRQSNIIALTLIHI